MEGLGISPSKAALLIGFMSIASTISRFVFGKFSDHQRVNRLFMTQIAITGFGVTTTLCPLAKSYASPIVVVVFLGLFDGLYVVLIAVLKYGHRRSTQAIRCAWKLIRRHLPYSDTGASLCRYDIIKFCMFPNLAVNWSCNIMKYIYLNCG